MTDEYSDWYIRNHHAHWRYFSSNILNDNMKKEYKDFVITQNWFRDCVSISYKSQLFLILDIDNYGLNIKYTKSHVTGVDEV